MTPQERQLIEELFDRLAALENAPRDPDAVAAINDALDRAPNALYPLVQTVLVQDEALRRAEARIRELEGRDGGGEQPARQESFLDGMRSAVAGRAGQGSVPSVRPAEAAPRPSVWGSGQTLPPGYRPAQDAGAPGYGAPPESGGGGGSFLGTAAATAAGVVGGALLMNSLRGLFGGGHQGAGHGAFNPNPGGSGSGAPWGSGAAGSDLSREAGLDDIGRSGHGTGGTGDATQRAGLFDTAQNDRSADDSDDSDDDFGDDAGDDDVDTA